MNFSVVSTLIVDSEFEVSVEDIVKIELDSGEVVIGEVIDIDSIGLQIHSELLSDLEISIDDISYIEKINQEVN